MSHPRCARWLKKKKGGDVGPRSIPHDERGMMIGARKKRAKWEEKYPTEGSTWKTGRIRADQKDQMRSLLAPVRAAA